MRWEVDQKVRRSVSVVFKFSKFNDRRLPAFSANAPIGTARVLSQTGEGHEQT